MTANNAVGDDNEGEVHRRGLFAALLGLGAVGLAACREDQALAVASASATGAAGTVVVDWADTILGTFTATTRNGDLATKTATAIDATGKTVIVVAKGCVAAGDGGGGVFFWDTTSSVDDGGMFIVPNSGGSGHVGVTGAGWRRIHSGPLNVKWFGARGDGTTNDHDALQNAINAATAVGAKNGAVYLPGGTPDAVPRTGSYLTDGLSVPGPVSLHGDGPDRSALVLAANSPAALLTSIYSLSLRGIRLDGAIGPSQPLLVFQGDSGGLAIDACSFVDPKLAAVDIVRLNTTARVLDSHFYFRTTGAYPSGFLIVEAATADGGNLVVKGCSFVNPSPPATAAAWGLQLQGKASSGPGGSDGVSADVSGNYFFQIGTDASGAHPLGCVDIYNWVGRTVIEGNRFYRSRFSAIKVANSSAIVVANNVVAEAASGYAAAAISFAGQLPGHVVSPAIPNGPFGDVIVKGNIIRTHLSGPAVYIAGDESGESTMAPRYLLAANVIDGAASGIQLHAATDVLIVDCIIANTTGMTIYDGGVRLEHTIGTVSEVAIRNCQFHDVGGYGVFAAEGYPNQGLRLTVDGCTFNASVQTSFAHVRLGSLAGAGPIRRARILDNTFSGPSGAAPTTLELAGAGVLALEVRDNLVEACPPPNLPSSARHEGNSWDATSASATFPTLASLASASSTLTLPGALVGDVVSVAYDTQPSPLPVGLVFRGVVTSPNTITVTCHNVSGSSVTVPAGILRVATSRPA